MEFCIYKINQTGEYNADVLAKFPGGSREGYTVLECGYKTRDEAMQRIKEIEKTSEK
ncbi:MAG: hypothetical protein IEMM0002_0999 [bacterium]|nr:MAG: hypothetical protein IEMM0002_0999 [bacterium]